MDLFTHWLQLDASLRVALLGAVVGLVMALTGAGGGVLAVPLLMGGLQLSIQQAAPVALAAVGLAALTGALLGFREGILRYRAAGLIGLLGLLAAPLGVWLAHQLPGAPLQIGFALLLGWIGWRMARGPQAALDAERALPPCVVNPREGRLRWTAPCAWALAATGALAGLMSGLLGVGGGFVIVPALTRFSDLDARSIASTSLAVIAMVAVSGLLAASRYGSLDLGLTLPFGAAAVGALLLVRRLARHWPARVLQLSFGLLSAVVALWMLLHTLLAWRG